MLAVLAGVAAAELLTGCGPGRVVAVGALEPSPALHLPRQTGVLSLELTPRTQNLIQIESDGSFPAVHVHDFRQTLARGFQRGFGGAFRLSRSAPGRQIIRLEVTGLTFVDSPHALAPQAGPTPEAEIVLVHGGASIGHSPAPPRRQRYAAIRFSASLLDSGAELARISSVALAEIAADGKQEAIASSIASAVAVLYQQIGREFFLRQTARRTALPD